jgi:hypothetical protein
VAHQGNDPLLPFQRLDVYRVARELLQRVTDAKIRDNELRDQATRAASGTAADTIGGRLSSSSSLLVAVVVVVVVVAVVV